MEVCLTNKVVFTGTVCIIQDGNLLVKNMNAVLVVMLIVRLSTVPEVGVSRQFGSIAPLKISLSHNVSRSNPQTVKVVSTFLSPCRSIELLYNLSEKVKFYFSCDYRYIYSFLEGKWRFKEKLVTVF